MDEVWEQVSLLLANGHVHAGVYPIWMVSEEVVFVTKRVNRELASAATLQQMALATIPRENVKASATKSMGQSFANIIKKMTGG